MYVVNDTEQLPVVLAKNSPAQPGERVVNAAGTVLAESREHERGLAWALTTEGMEAYKASWAGIWS